MVILASCRPKDNGPGQKDAVFLSYRIVPVQHFTFSSFAGWHSFSLQRDYFRDDYRDRNMGRSAHSHW